MPETKPDPLNLTPRQIEALKVFVLESEQTRLRLEQKVRALPFGDALLDDVDRGPVHSGMKRKG